ncbi:MAG: sensor histidine kinase [Chloroflexota bacterium]
MLRLLKTEPRGQAPRLEAARVVITVLIVLVGLSVVLGIGLMIFNALTIPGYRPRAWYNTALSAGMVVSSWLALRLVRRRLEPGIACLCLTNMALVLTMHLLDRRTYAARPEELLVSALLSLYVPHLGILLASLIGGFRAGLVTAGGGILFLICLSDYLSRPGDMLTPAIIALALPFTSVLVERLLDAVEQESRRAQHAETLVQIMAHDLGNPVSTVCASLEILTQTDLPPGESDGLIENIRQSTQLLRYLLDEFRRLPGPSAKLTMERLRLDVLVREAVELYAGFGCHRRGQTLHVDVEPVTVLGSRSRLSSLLRELITNASKYTPSGGEIRVSLRADGQAVLRVSDNGWGLAPEEAALVFEPGWRGDQACQDKVPGTGLGLYIVGRIVKQHGGRIEVQSQPNQGTIFTILLPLIKEEMPQGG